MGQMHDKAREQRWRDNGNRRLSARISGRAWVVLGNLAEAFGCTRRDAMEALLLGVIHPAAGRAREAWRVSQGAPVPFFRPRLTMRITRRAALVLEQLEAQYGCNRCDAVEGLLLGTVTVSPAAQLDQLAHAERLSEPERVLLHVLAVHP